MRRLDVHYRAAAVAVVDEEVRRKRGRIRSKADPEVASQSRVTRTSSSMAFAHAAFPAADAANSQPGPPPDCPGPPREQRHALPVPPIDVDYERAEPFPSRFACDSHAAACRSTSFSCSSNLILLRASLSSADSEPVARGALPSSSLARRNHSRSVIG